MDNSQEAIGLESLKKRIENWNHRLLAIHLIITELQEEFQQIYKSVCEFQELKEDLP